MQENTSYLAVPSDGWPQMLIYRKDLFASQGLQPPTSYEDIEKALPRLSQKGIYAFVVASKAKENYLSQTLEHLFLTNGVDLSIPDAVAIQREAIKNSLRFYKKLVQAGPSKPMSWKDARSYYLSGQAAMIFWSPYILDELAGLKDALKPYIPKGKPSDALAKQSGFLTRLYGPNHPEGASWAEIKYYSVTSHAKTDAAKKFILYLMSTAYLDTLSVAPEGKLPFRLGTNNEPTRFKEAWMQLPIGVDRTARINEIYDKDVIRKIFSGLASMQRWGTQANTLQKSSKMLNAKNVNQIAVAYANDRISLDEALERMQSHLESIS